MNTARRHRREFDTRDQDERAFRARVQAGDYSIVPHDGSFILEKATNAYIVSDTTCSCPDWEHRIRHVDGARCKHQLLIGSWLLETGQSWPEAEIDGARCSQCGADRADTELYPVPETGELVCQFCVPVPMDAPELPAGPDDLATPAFAYTDEDALFDRLFG